MNAGVSRTEEFCYPPNIGRWCTVREEGGAQHSSDGESTFAVLAIDYEPLPRERRLGDGKWRGFTPSVSVYLGKFMRRIKS